MEDRISVVLVTKESKKGASLDYKSVVPFTEKQYDDFFEQLIQKNFYFACQFCRVIELDHKEENYYAILSSETLSFESKKKDELAKLEILASEFLRKNRLVGYNEQTNEWFE